MSDATTGSTGYGLSGAHAGTRISAPVLPYLPRRPASSKLKIGLVGCGGISEYHLRAYRAMGLDVVALFDRQIDRAERRRAEFYPEATVCKSLADMLAQEDISIVDLALHPEERASAIEQALEAGKHVLSQKPFVHDLELGERLVALAETKNLKLAVNQNGRWAPHFSYLTAAIRAGLIGEVASVDFTIQWDHTWTAGTPFENIHHLVLFDFGIHWFDLAAQFLDGREPSRVWASVARTSFQQMKPPMLAAAVIDYPNAQVRLSFNGHVQHGQEDRTVICGSQGTLRSFGPSLSEQSVTLSTSAGTASVSLEGTWFTNGFQGAMGELLCAIEEDRPPSNSARQNLRSLELCFTALASANTGQPTVPGSVRSLPVGKDDPISGP